VSKSSARRATQLLKFRPYKTTVIHALQLCDLAGTVHFCGWFLHGVVEVEIDPQLTGIALSAPPMICEFELLHSKRYWRTGILIHQQNPYAPHSRQCTGRREA
jgi:hypothetical protein